MISRPVKSLLPRGGVINARNIYPLFLRFLPCHRAKSNFTGCIAVLSVIFFVQTKRQNLGNTLCITEIFCEVWAKKSRSKPTYPYLSPPKRNPASGVLYSLLASFRPGQVVAHVEQRTQYVVRCAAVKCDGEPVFLVHVICGENAASALKRCH